MMWMCWLQCTMTEFACYGVRQHGGFAGGHDERLGVMMEQGGSKHMLYLILFVVLVFVLLYFTIRSH
ncbi:unnamed protein product [Peronospora destructor]|uniref:Uncharacterized protein n=1 Tax=Peronospora destructor TaxID=86335 RepID=A0AAV0UMG8_9STRA|nr:unnamed protein product [Peronospora destructor]